MTPLREELARTMDRDAFRDMDSMRGQQAQCRVQMSFGEFGKMTARRVGRAFENADAILPILTREIAAARKAALEEAAKCADDAGDLWWCAYKTIGSGNCADDHTQGKADGAGEIAAAIRKLGEPPPQPK
jgi:hypothetical protein